MTRPRQQRVVQEASEYEYLKALVRALPVGRTADDFEALLPWRMTLAD